VLADLHYSKAVKLFQLLKDAPCELLRVQLERVAFAEYQMASKSDFSLLKSVLVSLVSDCLRGRASCMSLLDINGSVF
jgi:hypothetical protein